MQAYANFMNILTSHELPYVESITNVIRYLHEGGLMNKWREIEFERVSKGRGTTKTKDRV